MKFEWEHIHSSNAWDYTERAKVIGGWVLRNCIKDKQCYEADNNAICMVFIPDPEHKWDIE